MLACSPVDVDEGRSCRSYFRLATPTVQRYKTRWPPRRDRKDPDPAFKWADASSSVRPEDSSASSRKQQLLCY
ncbi:hypothetical protein WJX79_008620 [Trebouxia sp. C0005]